MLAYVVVALVQVLTESLPISSSGHIALLSKYMSLAYDIVDQYIRIIYYCAHLLNASVVMFLLISQWWHWLQGMHTLHPTTIFRSLGCKLWALLRHPFVMQRLYVTMGVTLITIIMYGFAKPWMEQIPLVIGICCTIGLVISASYIFPAYERPYTWRDIIWLGCAQSCAFIPGISRLAITVVVGQLTGMSRYQSFITSLYLQLPLMVGAGILGVFEWHQAAYIFPHLSCYQWLIVWASMVCAVVAAYWLLRLTQWLIVTNRMYYFAWYLLIPLCMELATNWL